MLPRCVFEHFTEAARDVVRLAHKEARLMRHGRVGTEHLLVGLAWAAGADEAGAVLRARLEAHDRPTPSTPAGPGTPKADGEALLAILDRHGAVAAWLREHGVDERAVREMLGEA